MPLSQASKGQEYRILQLNGREKIQRQLMNMGLVPGAVVRLVGFLDKNAIIALKEEKLGIGQELLQRIIVEQVAAQSPSYP